MDENQRKIVEGLTLLIKTSLDETLEIIRRDVKEIPFPIRPLVLASDVLNIVNKIPYYPQEERKRLKNRYESINHMAPVVAVDEKIYGGLFGL